MHTNPEVLALLALGEHAADPADRAHLDACLRCRDELETLRRLINPDPVEGGDRATTPDAPSEAVWAAIQAELGFIPVTRSWPSVPEAGVAPAPAPSAPEPSVPEPSVPEPGVPEPRRLDPRLALVVSVLVVLILALGLWVALG
ncbi:hypothetical protein [Microlunatus ginsengisoli]|uniref:Zinc-finger n=1 Tax=Microlunatus ginsengisoli TaxID=363863 RepID=A0ABP7A404_9ACTN